MKQRWIKLSVIVLAALIGVVAAVTGWSVHQLNIEHLSKIRVHSGDQPEWKETSFDDTQWLDYQQWQRKNGRYKGNLWIRQPLVISDDAHLNIFVLAAVGSSEIYFDGELIGQNGKVGSSRESEVAGSLLYTCTIPERLLTPGTHQVALRFSNYRGIGRFYLLGGGLGSVDDLLSFARRSMLPFMFLSVFLVVAFYFLVLFMLNRKEGSLLAFALLCGTTGLLLFVEAIRSVGYPYYWHGYRLVLVTFLSALLSALIPLFFILQHGMSKRWLYGIPLTLLLGVALYHRSFDQISFGCFSSSFLYSQLLLGIAFWREKEDAWLGLLGVSLTLTTQIFSGMSFMEGWLFGGLTILIMLILISLGLQINRQRRRYQEARLRSARLQIELLKKHLQPHFMLNTLTAVMEWLEREPKKGVAFIGLLAEEMKTLNRMAGETLVSLEEELQLCENHLKILAYRNEERNPLEMDCENPDLLIPPALILTLVENGVSYSLDEGIVAFHIRQWVTPEGVIRIEFKAMGVDVQAGKADEGTGTKYLRARLEESFPGRWKLNASGSGQTWTTDMEILGAT